MKEEIKPQFIPVKCPVCLGHTTVDYGKKQCLACKGKGYIPVPPKEDNAKQE